MVRSWASGLAMAVSHVALPRKGRSQTTPAPGPLTMVAKTRPSVPLSSTLSRMRASVPSPLAALWKASGPPRSAEVSLLRRLTPAKWMSLDFAPAHHRVDQIVGEGDLQRRLVDHQAVDERSGTAIVAQQPRRGGELVDDEDGDRAVAIVEGGEPVGGSGEHAVGGQRVAGRQGSRSDGRSEWRRRDRAQWQWTDRWAWGTLPSPLYLQWLIAIRRGV